MVKVPPWQRPQLGSCASPGRAWRLWAARHSQEEAGPLGAHATASMLELATSKAADFTPLTLQVQPMLEPVAALRAGLDAHEALVARVGGTP